MGGQTRSGTGTGGLLIVNRIAGIRWLLRFTGGNTSPQLHNYNTGIVSFPCIASSLPRSL